MIWTAAMAWIGWNVIGPILVGAPVIFVIVAAMIPGAVRRARCQHFRFHETRACDAICSDCGKNLGFIDNARARLRASREG